MKPICLLTVLLLLALALGATITLTFTTVAQEKKKPTTWAERKAETLKPLTAEQKQLIEDAVPAKAAAEPRKPRNVLVFYRCEGYVHPSISPGNHSLQRLGEKTGAYTAEIADSYDVFTTENLANFDAVLFNNTTRLVFPDEEKKKALMDFVAGGKGIIGLHGAADNFGTWPEALAMMGGIFNGHPWNAGGSWAFKLDDPGHKLNAAFNGKGFWHQDEIYQYKPDSYQGEKNLRLLVSLDMNKARNTDALNNPKLERFNEIYGGAKREVPVSWCREVNGGRLFYSNFGHRPETFWNPEMLRHFLDGIQFAIGDLEADAKPTATLEGIRPALAPDQ